MRTFENEAALLSRCSHENIVQFIELYQGPRELALVLEAIPGGDAQMLLRRHGALTERAASAIVRQLASALHHMHSLSVLHRDVKLENLLVVRPGASPIIKLCDFGHAAPISAADDAFTGTVGYAAPEVVGTQGVPQWTTAADAWSVGVVHYSLLSNSPLLWAADGPDFSMRVLQSVTVASKLLIKSLLKVRVAERASLEHTVRMLSDPLPVSATQTGMRKSFSASHRSYSLQDLSAFDDERSVHRVDVHLASGSSLSESASHEHLSGLGGSSAPSAPHAPEHAGAPPPRPGTADEASGGVECQKHSCWRGAYARVLRVEEGAQRVVTLDPADGRVTNAWPFTRILGVIDDRASGPAQPSEPPPSESQGTVSLLLEGAPSLLCLSGCLVHRLRFSVQRPEAHEPLLGQLRAAIACAAVGALPVPVSTVEGSSVESLESQQHAIPRGMPSMEGTSPRPRRHSMDFHPSLDGGATAETRKRRPSRGAPPFGLEPSRRRSVPESDGGGDVHCAVDGVDTHGAAVRTNTNTTGSAISGDSAGAGDEGSDAAGGSGGNDSRHPSGAGVNGVCAAPIHSAVSPRAGYGGVGLRRLGKASASCGELCLLSGTEPSSVVGGVASPAVPSPQPASGVGPPFASSGASVVSAQEAQLKRMRERFQALRAAQAPSGNS